MSHPGGLCLGRPRLEGVPPIQGVGWLSWSRWAESSDRSWGWSLRPPSRTFGLHGIRTFAAELCSAGLLNGHTHFEYFTGLLSGHSRIWSALTEFRLMPTPPQSLSLALRRWSLTCRTSLKGEVAGAGRMSTQIGVAFIREDCDQLVGCRCRLFYLIINGFHC